MYNILYLINSNATGGTGTATDITSTSEAQNIIATYCPNVTSVYLVDTLDNLPNIGSSKSGDAYSFIVMPRPGVFEGDTVEISLASDLTIYPAFVMLGGAYTLSVTRKKIVARKTATFRNVYLYNLASYASYPTGAATGEFVTSNATFATLNINVATATLCGSFTAAFISPGVYGSTTSLTFDAGSTLNVDRSTILYSYYSGTVVFNGSIVFTGGYAFKAYFGDSGTGTLNFSGATLSGSGYLATQNVSGTTVVAPSNVPSTVVVCKCATGSLTLTDAGDGSATLTRASGGSEACCVEYRYSDSDAWTLYSAAFTGSTITPPEYGSAPIQVRALGAYGWYSGTIAQEPPVSFARAFYASTPTSAPGATYEFAAQTSTGYEIARLFLRPDRHAYEIKQEFLMTSDYSNTGESVLLMARIVDSGTDEDDLTELFDTATYTCYKVVTNWGVKTRTAVTNHSAVSIPSSAFKTALVTSDSRWTLDTTGYNFIYEPDGRTNALFPTSGNYEIEVTFTPETGNLVKLVFEITVD